MFEPEQEILWLYTQRGGWNLQGWVKGVVKQATTKRVQIEATNRKGEKVLRWVKPENVKPR